MSTPKQIDTITARMMVIDPDRAADFSDAMYKANNLARRAAELRRGAWRLRREVFGLPKLLPGIKKPKGGVR